MTKKSYGWNFRELKLALGVAELGSWIYIFALLIIPICTTFFVGNSISPLYTLVIYGWFSVVFCLSPLIFFSQKKTVAFSLLVLAIGAWVDCYVKLTYQGIPPALLFEILRTSGLREVQEYLWAHDLVLPITVIGLLVIIAFASIRFVQNGKFSDQTRKKILAANLCALFFSLSLPSLPNIPALNVLPLSMSSIVLSETYPANAVLLAKEGINRILFQSHDLKKSFHVRRNSQFGGRETHVLIIGESARFDRWHFHGYPRETSPELDKLVARKEMISFQKVHAAGNLTILSVPTILTGVAPSDFRDARRPRRGLLDLVQESGFMTAWISNHAQDVTSDLHVKANFHVELSNEMSRTHDYVDMVSRFSTDGEMLPILKRALQFDYSKKFIVLHTTGNHYDYSLRYPIDFERFSSKKDQLYGLDEAWKKNDEYDNSILYVDWFIGQVVDLLNETEGVATVTFISDHGEAIYEKSSGGYYGHGSSVGYLAEQHIPLFIWGNKGFRTLFEEKWHGLLNSRSKVVGQENLLHTYADILGIDYPGNSYHMSFAQKYYVPTANNQFLTGSGKAVPILVN